MFATSSENVAPIVEICSAQAERHLSSIGLSCYCRVKVSELFLALWLLFVFSFYSALTRFRVILILRITYSVAVKFPAILLLLFALISTCGNSTVLLVSPSVKVSSAEIFVATDGANT